MRDQILVVRYFISSTLMVLRKARLAYSTLSHPTEPNNVFMKVPIIPKKKIFDITALH